MTGDKEIVSKQILPYLSPPLQHIIMHLNDRFFASLEEIRLRSGQPLIMKIGDKDTAVNLKGELARSLDKAYVVTSEDIYRTIASISDNSLYAFEEEIRRGFITVQGGHRAGLAGQVIVEGNQVRTIKDFSGICLRIAREVKNCAEPVLRNVIPDGSQILNTLIISPPRCGKTTFLRDITRGISHAGQHNVVVVDERSEIAGCYRGIPQLDVGPRTDVLDACPKALGMIMAVRSLSPQAIITDEIGRMEDAEAILECINAGVAVISSVHAGGMRELSRRPVMKSLLEQKIFQLGIVLSRRKGPGTVEELIRWD
ncbi:MAG TPA: stage III sporulation protein AA [Syntrophomonadaceae bacterium]|nr:stage III sporulation protein AA [Syntrophomonadaceae bacterium]HRX20171.1 stage III sporulation protein AA [Syntrophomonadaceae bacterium]